jgi:hypothetical protein
MGSDRSDLRNRCRSRVIETIRGDIGASEGIRTLDIHLGKVTLYQTELRSHPKTDYPKTTKMQTSICVNVGKTGDIVTPVW